MFLSELIKKIKFSQIFSFVTILTFLFSEVFLGEDIILGIIASTLLFVFYFLAREYQTDQAREIRLTTKKILRIQKKMFRKYSFFFCKINLIIYKYLRKLYYNRFFVKFYRIYFKFTAVRRVCVTRICNIKLIMINLILQIHSEILERLIIC